MADAEAAADTTLLRQEAKSLADIGDFDRARETLARAIDAAPDDPELHAFMAWYTCKCRALDPHERDRLAKHHLAVSFEQAPDNAAAHYCQGQIWLAQGNGPRAKTSFEAAVRRRPDYTPAITALEKLGLRTTSAVTLDYMPAQGGRRGPSRQVVRGSIVALTVMAVGAGAVGYVMLSADDRENSAFAKELGTKFKLKSVSKVTDTLAIDVGLSWNKFNGADRVNELKSMGTAAKERGFKHVLVFSESVAVAEVHDGKVCADQACISLPPPLNAAAPPPAASPPKPTPPVPASAAPKAPATPAVPTAPRPAAPTAGSPPASPPAPGDRKPPRAGAN